MTDAIVPAISSQLSSNEMRKLVVDWGVGLVVVVAVVIVWKQEPRANDERDGCTA